MTAKTRFAFFLAERGRSKETGRGRRQSLSHPTANNPAVLAEKGAKYAIFIKIYTGVAGNKASYRNTIQIL